MNLVLDDASEIFLKKDGERQRIGRMMLKGDNITLIAPAQGLEMHS